MYAKTKIESGNSLLTILGSWAVTLVTLVSSVQVSRSLRAGAAINTMRPAYAYNNISSDLWNRNDNENETVHLPTKFDVGIQVPAATGRK